MTKPATFRQADATRAFRAALAAGLTLREVVIEPSGAIRMLCGEETPASAANPLDRLLKQ
jgi:hypothetical protein